MIDEQVWLGLIVSTVCVTAALNLVDGTLKEPRNENLVADRKHTAKRKSGRAGKQYLYVFGNLMSQSQTEWLDIKLKRDKLTLIMQ